MVDAGQRQFGRFCQFAPNRGAFAAVLGKGQTASQPQSLPCGYLNER